MYKIHKLILLFAAIFILSCEVEELPIPDDNHADIELEETYYYNNEILMDSNLYGKWYINSIRGGFTGYGYSPQFDILSIEKIGIFKLFRNDSIIAFGKVDILKQTDESLRLSFIVDSIFDPFNENMIDDLIKWEKDAIVSDSSLVLMDGCCDRYNYYFTNCNCYENEVYFQENSQIENVLISEVLMPEENWYDNLCFIDDNRGYVLSNGNTILKTEDGGVSWSKYVIGTVTGLRLKTIAFQNNSIGYAVGEIQNTCTKCPSRTAVMFKTINGGISWKEIKLPEPTWPVSTNLEFIYFVNNIGYAFGQSVSIKTIDGGETWNKLDYNGSSSISVMNFLDEWTGYVGYYRTKIYKTTDGGNSWIEQITNAHAHSSIHFVDNNTGFLGNSGFLLKSIDGGNSWSELEFSPQGVSYMNFENTKRGIVFGSRDYTNGNCNVWTSYMNFTEDSGKFWKGDIRIGYPKSVSFIDGNKCFVLIGKKLYLIQY